MQLAEHLGRMQAPMVMPMVGPVRWGIVGCGDVCEVKSGPALQGAAKSQNVLSCVWPA